MYSGITDFNRSFDIDEKVFERIDKLLKAHDKKQQALRDKIQSLSKDKSPEEVKEVENNINREYLEILNQQVTFNMAMVAKSDLENVQLTAGEVISIKEFIVQ